MTTPNPDSPMPEPDPRNPPAGNLRHDLISAYLLTAARLASWLVVAGLVFRIDGPEAFAVFILLRGVTSLLSFASLGVGPAMLPLLAQALKPRAVKTLQEETEEHTAADTDTSPGTQPVLDYARPMSKPRKPPPPVTEVHRVFLSGLWIVMIMGVVAAFVLVWYASSLNWLHAIPRQVDQPALLALLLGAGALLRAGSEPAGAVIQAHGRIWLDNLIGLFGELIWMGGTLHLAREDGPIVMEAAALFAMSGLAVVLLRMLCAAGLANAPIRDDSKDYPAERLISAGLLITLAQISDYLYAPIDYILINRLISADAVAVYAPAVQLDSAMLLLVGAIALVLLPRSALAHARGDVDLIRRYYVRGTLISLALLTGAAVVLYLLAPILFRLWLGEPMPQTVAILPLVFIHTIIGGSSGVGRSILLGMGRIKAYTAAAWSAALANVLISYVLVVHGGLGLKGIVIGTIVAVVARCAIWMPWYILRTLKQSPKIDLSESPAPAPPV